MALWLKRRPGNRNDDSDQGATKISQVQRLETVGSTERLPNLWTGETKTTSVVRPRNIVKHITLLTQTQTTTKQLTTAPGPAIVGCGPVGSSSRHSGVTFGVPAAGLEGLMQHILATIELLRWTESKANTEWTPWFLVP